MCLCLQGEAETLLSIIEMSSCFKDVVMRLHIQKLDILIHFLFHSRRLIRIIFEVILRLPYSEQLIGSRNALQGGS
jgi:hypothetical protein